MKDVFGGRDVNHRCRVTSEVLDEVFVLLGVVENRVSWLDGTEVVPGLHLGGGESVSGAMMDAVEGDLPCTDGDIL